MSLGSDSRQGNGCSSYPSISHNGRWIAFESTATNFMRADKNGQSFDVFVRDRRTRTTRLVSPSSKGEQGNRDSRYPDFSRDGRFVVFTSEADNLVPNDENDVSDIFIRDLRLRTTQRVTVGFDGRETDGPSFFPHVSGDGRYVVFTSNASNLVIADINRRMDAFVVDREERTTERVSITSDGLQVYASTDYAVISDDGSTVAFTSWAESLDPRYEDEWLDVQQVYVHDRLTQETELGAVNSEGRETDDQSLSPSLSRDGRFLVFSEDGSLMSWGEWCSAGLLAGSRPGRDQDCFGRPREVKLAGPTLWVGSSLGTVAGSFSLATRSISFLAGGMTPNPMSSYAICGLVGASGR